MRHRGSTFRTALLAVGFAIVASLAERAEAQIYTRTNPDGVVEATNIPDASDFRLTYPGKGTLIHSLGFRRSYIGEFDHHIDAAGVAYGVAVDLIKAVIAVESEFDHLAVSSKGAQGLMQLMPFTARRFGVSNSFDPRQNIFGGAQYLRFLLDLFQGDVALALAGYNAGENAVLRYRGIPPYKETRNYVQKIQALLSSGVRAISYAARRSPAPPLSFAPGNTPARAPARRNALVPARPRIYYKYVDSRGVLHVSQEPPGEGVAYTMLRAMD